MCGGHSGSPQGHTAFITGHLSISCGTPYTRLQKIEIFAYMSIYVMGGGVVNWCWGTVSLNEWYVLSFRTRMQQINNNGCLLSLVWFKKSTGFVAQPSTLKKLRMPSSRLWRRRPTIHRHKNVMRCCRIPEWRTLFPPLCCYCCCCHIYVCVYTKKTCAYME